MMDAQYKEKFAAAESSGKKQQLQLQTPNTYYNTSLLHTCKQQKTWNWNVETKGNRTLLKWSKDETNPCLAKPYKLLYEINERQMTNDKWWAASDAL